MRNKPFRSTFTRKMILRCVRMGLLASLGYVLLIAAAYFVLHRMIVWQPSLLYDFLESLEPFVTLLIPVGWLILILAVIYLQWKRTVGYIEQVVTASADLVRPDKEFVRLPEELREVEDRMNQIKRTALKNEQKAREAERRKNDLVVNIAHDIRTPLSSVIGYLSLLDEAPDMPEKQCRKYTGITLEKAYRLEQLMNEFFEITRFNVSSIVLNMGEIHLAFMLQQMADEFYPMLSPQNKKAVVQAPGDLILWGDADKLSRVFNNILKNAIAYSYDGSTIAITAMEREGKVIIQFTNQGDPIPKQKLSTIFERFFRLDAARSSKTGGTGLGLAIAKEIVMAHKGTITAESNETKTRFTVVLPNRRGKQRG